MQYLTYFLFGITVVFLRILALLYSGLTTTL